MKDTDKELFFVKEINKEDKSVVIEGTMFTDQIKIEHNDDFFEFAVDQVKFEQENGESIFFTIDFDENGQPSGYGEV